MASLSRPRAYALVVGVMAAFALAIACVGLFGVLSYSVAQRRARSACARPSARQPPTSSCSCCDRGSRLSPPDLPAGSPPRDYWSQSLSKILYGVGPFDPVTFTMVPLFLVLAAAVACVAPARRAARIDPLRALRGD